MITLRNRNAIEFNNNWLGFIRVFGVKGILANFSCHIFHQFFSFKKFDAAVCIALFVTRS